jgi:hypothetical protein
MYQTGNPNPFFFTYPYFYISAPPVSLIPAEFTTEETLKDAMQYKLLPSTVIENHRGLY